MFGCMALALVLMGETGTMLFVVVGSFGLSILVGAIRWYNNRPEQS